MQTTGDLQYERKEREKLNKVENFIEVVRVISSKICQATAFKIARFCYL